MTDDDLRFFGDKRRLRQKGGYSGDDGRTMAEEAPMRVDEASDKEPAGQPFGN
jgi:hypothetical protein